MHDLLVRMQSEQEVPNTLQNRLFLSLNDLAQEHYGAILHLVRTGQHTGSAFALLRPLLEVCLRGIWANRCATDKALEQITKRKATFPSLKSLAKTVGASFEGIGAKGIFAVSDNFVNALHGLTHGGVEALAFRVNSDTGKIFPDYPDEEIERLLTRAASFTTTMAIVRSQVFSGSWDTSSPSTTKIVEMYTALFRINRS